MNGIAIPDFISAWSQSPFGNLKELPWEITQQAISHVRNAQIALGSDFHIENEVAVHVSATVEQNTQLKGPIVIGPNCLVASGTYLRGGVFLEQGCVIGPNSELKSSFMFAGSKIAHLSFVGDSIIGSAVNIEAGAIIANYRNEFDDKTIRIAYENDVIKTCVQKFGALIGDGVRIGANAVIAPGAIIAAKTTIGRLAHVDQYPIDRT